MTELTAEEIEILCKALEALRLEAGRDIAMGTMLATLLSDTQPLWTESP